MLQPNNNGQDDGTDKASTITNDRRETADNRQDKRQQTRQEKRDNRGHAATGKKRAAIDEATVTIGSKTTWVATGKTTAATSENL